jgi:hypothetical protein
MNFTVPELMNSWKGYLLAGAASLFLFLFLYAPADFVYRVLESRIAEQQIVLHGLKGSWLFGSAAGGRIQQMPIGKVTWNMRPSLGALAKVKVSMSLGENSRVNCGLRPGMGGRLALDDLEADFPLRQLRQILSRFFLDLDGRAVLRFGKIKLERGVLQEAEGTVVLSQLRILQPMNVLLGDLKAEVTTSSEGVKLVLTDGGGQLSANGLLLLKPDGSYSFSGDFAARGQENGDLATALQLLGPAGRDGRVRVAYSGKFE